MTAATMQVPRRRIEGRVTLQGMAIDPLTEDQAIEQIFAEIAACRGGMVLTPNLDHLQRYHRDPSVRPAYRRAQLVLADGMPLVWASRLQGTPLPERVPGSNLVWTIAHRAAAERRRLFLLGGAPGVADAASSCLLARIGDLNLVGTHCPDYGFLDRPGDVAAMSAAVVSADPSIVFVGLPSPIAERVIEGLLECLPRAWFLGVGVSLSFIAGDVRRAPRWMHRLGLEWVWRLSQEPRRLARRYLLVGLPFAVRLALTAVASRRHARH